MPMEEKVATRPGIMKLWFSTYFPMPVVPVRSKVGDEEIAVYRREHGDQEGCGDTSLRIARSMRGHGLGGSTPCSSTESISTSKKRSAPTGRGSRTCLVLREMDRETSPPFPGPKS